MGLCGKPKCKAERAAAARKRARALAQGKKKTGITTINGKKFKYTLG